MPLPPIQRLFLYLTELPAAAVVDRFKASLSLTLPRFYSLAGKLDYLPRSTTWSLPSPPTTGGDLRQLVDAADHDVEMFMKLVPVTDVKELPAPVFTLQVTEFPGQGVAVGFSVHHLAIDGKAVWQFIEAWTAECQGLAGAAVQLRNEKLPIPRDDGLKAARRTFTLSAAAVEALRAEGAGGGGAAPPTAFVALAAHGWISALKAKLVPADEQDAALCFFLDLRPHLDPPVPANFFGNCQKPCAVYAKAADLLAAGGLKVAVAAIEKEIAACLKDPLVDSKSWLEKLFKLPRPRRVGVQAWPDLRVYETADFGFGRPARVELVSMNHDGDVVLVAAREEEGGVQASVALSAVYMDAFAALFVAPREWDPLAFEK
ncbi:unnamed protein product [Spirodela intermedia]|uniref:Uncharacterized protein n=1 Tax=Spirodela intermedia TaxID=51605 RepID=A0A7I8J2P0_SPIIN|nr:unnamed protein product [Spirodela intermedia]CAA6664486.1 unnamed protein product [Spirodela intermedia]